MRRHPAGKGAAAAPLTADPAPTGRHAVTNLSTKPDQPHVAYHLDQSDPSERREQQAFTQRSAQKDVPDRRELRCEAQHRVRRGDSLWELASSMEPGASAAEVQALTQQIYRLNRGTIGNDPDLIRPGQSLSLPKDCQR